MLVRIALRRVRHRIVRIPRILRMKVSKVDRMVLIREMQMRLRMMVRPVCSGILSRMG